MLRAMVRRFVVAAVAALLPWVPAHAGERVLPVPSACKAPAGLLQSAFPLQRTRGKLERGEAVKVVAIGSSSTFGTGASSPAASYPERLKAYLEILYPGAAITVLNRGVPGDNSTGMVARFRHDAVDSGADLIIWQTGTNSALGRGDLEQFSDDIVRGIDMARAAGIDIMLMGPQYAPRFEKAANRMAYIRHLRDIATLKSVPFFPRYQIMQHWIKTGQFTMAAMIDPDGLHLTDRSYECLARLVARMVAGAEVRVAYGPAR